MVERIPSRRPLLVDSMQAVEVRSGSPSASGSEMVRQKARAIPAVAAEMGQIDRCRGRRAGAQTSVATSQHRGLDKAFFIDEPSGRLVIRSAAGAMVYCDDPLGSP